MKADLALMRTGYMLGFGLVIGVVCGWSLLNTAYDLLNPVVTFAKTLI